MKTLLIGKKEDMPLVCQTLKNEKEIERTNHDDRETISWVLFVLF